MNLLRPRSVCYTRGVNKKLIIVAAVIVLGGILSGYLLMRRVSPQVAGSSSTVMMVKTDKEVGSTDTKTFRDSAEGALEEGGINGEGTHKLIRDGGPSQTVYLISSVVDLNEFLGKKVQVWGETIDAQKAGWLMDVGRVKILE